MNISKITCGIVNLMQTVSCDCGQQSVPQDKVEYEEIDSIVYSK